MTTVGPMSLSACNAAMCTMGSRYVALLFDRLLCCLLAQQCLLPYRTLTLARSTDTGTRPRSLGRSSAPQCGEAAR
jgi:hypothetical protein